MGATDDLAESLAAMGMLTVDVDRLLAFADGLWAEFEAFGTSVGEEILNPLASIVVNFGGGGLVEGFDFQHPYGQHQQALGDFLAEAWKGLATLNAGAMVVMARYAVGDSDSASLLAAVNEAFAPPTAAEYSRAAELAADAEETSPAETRAREALHAGQNALSTFRAEVRAQDALLAGDLREDVLSGDPELVFPSSDHSDEESVLRADGQVIVTRGVAGSGTGAIAIGRDQQNVDRWPLPDLDPSTTVIDDLDIIVPPSVLPIETQRAITEVREEWQTDPPGTEND